MALGSPPGGSEKETLGPYQLVAELHKGFLGSLWLAVMADDRGAGQLAVVRRVTLDGEVDEASAAAVGDAAEWGEQLAHQNLVPLLEVARTETEVGIGSSYVESESLRSLLRLAGIGRKPAPAAVVLRIAKDLLEAVAYLHTKRRDDQPLLAAVSPDNVLVGGDGITRLLEPCVSWSAARAQAWRQQPKRACYDAPEQLVAQLGDEGDFDERSDIFTVGVLMWELLRNRPLFGGSTFDAVAERVKTAAIRRADSLKPAGGDAIPESVADVVAKALERDPDSRYQSATEMLAALEAEDLASPREVAAYVRDLAGEELVKQQRKVERARQELGVAGSSLSGAPSAPRSDAPPPPPPGAAALAPMAGSPGDRQKITMRGLQPMDDAASEEGGNIEEVGDIEDAGSTEQAGITEAAGEPARLEPEVDTGASEVAAEPVPEVELGDVAPTVAEDEGRAATRAAIAATAALAANAGGGNDFDMLSIADDPSQDEPMPDVAKKALDAAASQRDGAGKPNTLIIAGAVVALLLVGGGAALLASGGGGEAPTSTASATSSAAAPVPSSPAPGSAGRVQAASTSSASADPEDAGAGADTADAGEADAADDGADHQDAGAADAGEAPAASASAKKKGTPPGGPAKPRPKPKPKPKPTWTTPGGI